MSGAADAAGATGRGAADRRPQRGDLGLQEEEAHRVLRGDEEERTNALLEARRHAGSGLRGRRAEDRLPRAGLRAVGEGALHRQVAHQRLRLLLQGQADRLLPLLLLARNLDLLGDELERVLEAQLLGSGAEAGGAALGAGVLGLHAEWPELAEAES